VSRSGLGLLGAAWLSIALAFGAVWGCSGDQNNQNTGGASTQSTGSHPTGSASGGGTGSRGAAVGGGGSTSSSDGGSTSSCMPTTCADQNAACGGISDGCAGSLQWGQCPART